MASRASVRGIGDVYKTRDSRLGQLVEGAVERKNVNTDRYSRLGCLFKVDDGHVPTRLAERFRRA